MNEGELSVKKNKYSDEFLKCGFTSIVVAGIEKPQSVIYNQQNRLNSTNLNVILTLNIKTFQIRMYSILKTKLMASRKADLMQEAVTNSKTWLQLQLHICLLSELRSHTQLPRT